MQTFTRDQLYEAYKYDYLYHDGVEQVTLTTPAGSVATAQGKLEPEEEGPLRQMGEDVADAARTATWILWDATLAGLAPTENSTVTRSNGDTWRIQSVRRELWDTQWHCRTQKDR